MQENSTAPDRAEENRVRGYERFRNVKAYLDAKSGQRRSAPASRRGPARGLRRPGQAESARFQRQRALWHELKRSIPVSYLRSIGVDLQTLRLAAERDHENFLVALSMPLYPRWAGVEWQYLGEAGMRLPQGISEPDAIRVLREFARDRGYRCSIRYPDLKTVLIEPGGRVRRILYPPVLTFTGSCVVPASPAVEDVAG
jgi:hypothetical protein